jgi:serine/threonine-protein kinase HipA
VAALRRHGTDSNTDTPLLFRLAVANLAIGNRDAHAKNIGRLRSGDGAWRVSPAYDVMCTMAYADLDTMLPLQFGGAAHLSQLAPEALRKPTRPFGITSTLAMELVDDVSERLEARLEDALYAASLFAGPREVLTSIGSVVRATAAERRKRLLG